MESPDKKAPVSSNSTAPDGEGDLSKLKKISSVGKAPKEDVMELKNHAWGGVADGASQTDFMYKDECIVVDEDDVVTGHDTKWNCHRFVPGQPRGVLHRAFSVFLFNSKGQLLLQQRAKDKITFPGVWTNTCCSHPLYGQEPSELDTPEEIKAGSCMGAKRAAVRKLLHELGIDPAQVPLNKFKFLTRLHYYASDAVTHGPNTVWGEHEIDYILFIQAEVDLKPNPEEVEDVKYVTMAELDQMLADPDLLWSPWFRIIKERWLVGWWKSLKATLTTDKAVDVQGIHRFDPPPQHRCCAGVSGILEDGSGNSEKDVKQGAYGKVPIHPVRLAGSVGEFSAALQLKLFGGMQKNLKVANEDVEFCQDMLNKVSRSFAAVILQLPEEMCLDILVFYLVLRGLDTVEDDMTAFKDPKEKEALLVNFHKQALLDTNWRMDGVGEGDEAVLLQRFPHVSKTFASLPAQSREVIADITRRMGAGMAEFVGKDLGQGTTTTVEYNRYCHFVAGMIGEGLSRLFSATGKESESLALQVELANSMGLFLQKTNIIRDYLEDYVDGRAFWPQEVWKKYSKTGQLGEFALPHFRQNALNCLNHLVLDALDHVEDCLKYLSLLRNPEVFRFCAIPQIMAIATMAEVYNNEKVFTGVVKIRKGLAAQLILDSSSIEGVHKWFYAFAQVIKAKVSEQDANAKKTVESCERIMDLTADKAKTHGVTGNKMMLVGLLVLPALGYVVSTLQKNSWNPEPLMTGEMALCGIFLSYMVASVFL